MANVVNVVKELDMTTASSNVFQFVLNTLFSLKVLRHANVIKDTIYSTDLA